MPRSPLRESYNVNEILAIFASHILVAGMMVCLAISVRNLAERIVPGWQGFYLPWLALLVSFEGIYSRRLVQRESDLLTSLLVYRVAEWVVIALLIKLYLAISTGLSQFLREMLGWGEGFLANFFDPEYVFVLFLAFVVWYLSGDFASQLLELEGDRFLLETDVEMGIISDRTAVRRRLAMRILIIGMLVVFITALLRWDYQTLWGNRPAPTYSLSYVMMYFLMGMALITLAHFAARRAVWAMERIPISKELARTWLIYSLLFLLAVSVLAFILPTGYSMGLLVTIRYLIQLLSVMVYSIFYLLLQPFILLMRLFTKPSDLPQLEQPLSPPEFTPPPGPVAAPDGWPWLDLMRSIVFWAVFLAIAVYAFKTFIEQNEHLLHQLRALPAWRYLSAIWIWLTSTLKRAGRQARSILRTNLSRLDRSGQGRSAHQQEGFIRLKLLSSRQKVLFYYISLLRRSQQSGLPRHPSQTPAEYFRTLQNDLPEVDEDLKSLTSAFVEARYSQHVITAESANLVRHHWARIKRSLRARNKEAQGGPDRGA